VDAGEKSAIESPHSGSLRAEKRGNSRQGIKVLKRAAPVRLSFDPSERAIYAEGPFVIMQPCSQDHAGHLERPQIPHEGRDENGAEARQLKRAGSDRSVRDPGACTARRSVKPRESRSPAFGECEMCRRWADFITLAKGAVAKSETLKRRLVAKGGHLGKQLEAPLVTACL
jgi:hypothetical protein